jgi:glutathione S-transferase
MPARLFVVYGSHPCATVQRAMDLKGIPYSTVELPPLAHAAIQRLVFGQRTVPGLQIDGEKIVGSRRILRRLEEIAPDPALLPADPAQRARVEDAERWGDDVLQPIARRVLWTALRNAPGAAPSFSEGAQLALPAPVARAAIPLVARGEIRLNRASEAAVREDLLALPGHLDRIDAWIEEGVMGGEQPNVADLQIAPTLALLMTIGDLRPAIESHPAGQQALRLFPDTPGWIPPGALPAQWLAMPAAAPAGAPA